MEWLVRVGWLVGPSVQPGDASLFRNDFPPLLLLFLLLLFLLRADAVTIGVAAAVAAVAAMGSQRIRVGSRYELVNELLRIESCAVR